MVRVRIECLRCHTKMETERGFTGPARIKCVCVGCEQLVIVNLTAEDLARQFAADVAKID